MTTTDPETWAARELLVTAQAILDRQIDSVTGIRAMRACMSDGDPLWLPLAGLDSESDDLHDEEVLKLWTEEFQIENRKRRQEFLDFYGTAIVDLCRAIVER